MRHALLISVAAVALAAGSNVALSRGGATGGGASGGAGGSINAPMANPSGPGGAGGGLSKDTQSTMDNAPAQRGDRVAPAPGSKGAQDRAIPDKQRTTQQPPTQQRTTEQPAAGGARQGAAERPMTSKSVSLTTEQRTTIRRTVLTGSAPRVANVNFDIRVGVVVPRTVRVAPLPVSLIEIEPEWRGYMYFVHGDEIIVVDPATLRIVAVLDV